MPDSPRFKDRLGRLVSLPEARWDLIVRRRPQFVGKRDAVVETVRKPDFIRQDREGVRREHFYRKSTLPYPYERGYVKVTVDLGRFGSGLRFWQIPLTVVDADIVSSYPSKEISIWPPLKPGQAPM